MELLVVYYLVELLVRWLDLCKLVLGKSWGLSVWEGAL